MSPARDLVAFVVADRRCALDLAAVERAEPMVAVRPLPGSPAGVLGAVDVHGTPVAVLDVRGRLGFPPAPPDPDAVLLLARTSRRRVALPVDEVLGVVAADAVSTVPGGLFVIHDLDGFLSPDDERRLTPALAATAP